MINDIGIINAINNNGIKIFYSFKRNADNIEFIENESPFDISEHKENIYSDSIKISIGILVKTNKKKIFSFKKRFKKFYDCIDLRKNGYCYQLKPRESITVLSNERIEFNGEYAAIIVPKVSLSEVGINVSTAYIDPHYNGLLRLSITNSSDNTFELNILDCIARCFVFKFENPVSESFKVTFSNKSVFFGQNWKSILIDDRPPFPTKKDYVTTNKVADFFNYKLVNLWAFLKEYSFATNIILFICVLLIGFGSLKSKIEDYTTKVNKLNNAYNTIDSTQKTLKESMQIIKNLDKTFSLKKSEIVISKGLMTGTKRIKVPTAKEDILLLLTPDKNLKYNLFSGDNVDESIIEFEYNIQNKNSEDRVVNFEYIILKKLSVKQ